MSKIFFCEKVKRKVRSFFDLEAAESDHDEPEPKRSSGKKRGRPPCKSVGKDPKDPKPYRFCGKSILLTYPQCDRSKDWLMMHLQEIGMNLIVVSREKHTETDGYHLHAYGEWPEKKDFRDARTKFDFDGFHPNIGEDKSKGKKSAKSSKHDMIKYVVKDGDYIEYNIDVKEYLKAVKDKRAYICKDLIEGKLTAVQAVQKDPKLLLQFTNLVKNISLYKTMEKAETFAGRRDCYWIWGDSRIGKSYAVRKLFPNFYLKENNKWWDGYVGQDVVLIDDIDSDFLRHYLKIWADNYTFTGETKGGTVTVTNSLLFVTSNYAISELFMEPKIASAIEKRFNVIYANDYKVGGYFDINRTNLIYLRKI